MSHLNQEFKPDKAIINALMDKDVVYFPEFNAAQFKDFNPKDILVMVNYSNKDFPEQESALLGGIYNALKLDRSQTNFIDLGKKAITFKEAVNVLGAKYIILFGIEPSEIRVHINLRFYELIRLNQTQIIFSHQLADLLNNKAYKSNLWNALKKMFNIK